MARTRELSGQTYLGRAELDDIVRMNTELLSELWILRDRVTVLEHLLEQAKVIERSAIDNHVPEGALAAELDQERTRFVERVAGAPHRAPPSVEALKRQA